jgi:hypothetical protein
MKKYLFLGFIVVSGFACSKESGDNVKPVITVTSPGANEQFAPGTVVKVIANISDDHELHEVHLFVTKKPNGESIVHYMEHLDADTFTLNQSFTIEAGASYDIAIEASDHADNFAVAQMTVSSN